MRVQFIARVSNVHIFRVTEVVRLYGAHLPDDFVGVVQQFQFAHKIVTWPRESMHRDVFSLGGSGREPTLIILDGPVTTTTASVRKTKPSGLSNRFAALRQQLLETQL